MHHAHMCAESLGVPAVHCESREAALAELLRTCRTGDTVLLKASHGMQFEKILSAFYAQYEGRQQP